MTTDPKYSLVEMLRYRRPQGSETQRIFCDKYLKPVFGEPDAYGNYIKLINYPNGGAPYLCFTAHHDTVHTVDGMQHVIVNGDKLMAADSNCLGADCTTGVWLILEMVAAKVPGIYVIHAAEEKGCVGSKALVKDHPSWLDHTKAVISLDRKGEESVITHQMGYRTASDAFAVSFSEALDMPLLRPDDTGLYTDSNEYVDVVGECTNISVGYMNQHSKSETQDAYFAYYMREKLLAADWSKLVFEREPGTFEVDHSNFSRGSYNNYYDDDDWGYPYGSPKSRKGYSMLNMRGQLRGRNESELVDVIKEYPEEVAELLDEWGVDAAYLMEQLEQLMYMGYTSDAKVGK